MSASSVVAWSRGPSRPRGELGHAERASATVTDGAYVAVPDLTLPNLRAGDRTIYVVYGATIDVDATTVAAPWRCRLRLYRTDVGEIHVAEDRRVIPVGGTVHTFSLAGRARLTGLAPGESFPLFLEAQANPGFGYSGTGGTIRDAYLTVIEV